MGTGASVELPARMTLSQVEEKVGFQARLLGKVKERFEAVASQEDKTISKEHFLIGIANGMAGVPGGDRPPDELLLVKEEEARKALENEAKAKAKAAERAVTKAAAAKAAAEKKKTASKYDMSKFEVKAYNPEEVKRRKEDHDQQLKKRRDMLAMDASKAETERQRDKILRGQAREQEKMFDMNARKALTTLKEERSNMTAEEKQAERDAMPASSTVAKVSYDEEVGRNAVDTTIVETCSCLQGEPCVDKDNCLDWTNRVAVAKSYGMGFGKSKTGIHFSGGSSSASTNVGVDLQSQSTETLTVNGRVLGR